MNIEQSICINNEDVLFDVEGILINRKIQFLFKRIFDFLVSLFGIIIVSPILLIIAISIKINSKGPILFKQIRVGKDGKKFKILKFRTMTNNTEKKGLQLTVGRDNRITSTGHFLRKYKLDELPQLFNVLKGEMSLVGPRPEVPKYVEMYSEEQSKVLKVKPGITDLASIEYRDENTLIAKSKNPEETYINEIMPKKIELNIEYISRFSIFFDMKLIFDTILSIVIK